MPAHITGHIHTQSKKPLLVGGRKYKDKSLKPCCGSDKVCHPHQSCIKTLGAHCLPERTKRRNTVL